MWIAFHVKCPLFLSYFNETWIFSTNSRKKYSNIKFHENPSSGSRAVPCGQTDGKMRKLTVAFRNFANAPKSGSNDAASRRTYIGTRHMSRYRYSACLDRNSVQWKSRTAIERTIFQVLWRYLCMSDLKQSKYTTWAVNLKCVVELCSVVRHTNPVLTWHTQRRTE